MTEHDRERASTKESAQRIDARDHTLSRSDGSPSQQVKSPLGNRPQQEQGQGQSGGNQQQQDSSASQRQQGHESDANSSSTVKEDLHRSVDKRSESR